VFRGAIKVKLVFNFVDNLVASGGDDGQIMLSAALLGDKIEQISAYAGKVSYNQSKNIEYSCELTVF